MTVRVKNPDARPPMQDQIPDVFKGPLLPNLAEARPRCFDKPQPRPMRVKYF